MPDYKSFMGVDDLYYALVTQDDANAYAAGTPAYLAPLATVSNQPTVNGKIQFFDNIPMESLTAEGESKQTFEIQGMPPELAAILLGKTFDAVNGMAFDNGQQPPYVAVGYRALKTDNTYRYYWFLKGRFEQPKEDIATKTNTPDPKTVTLTYTAIRTTFQFAQTVSLTDSCKWVQADTSTAAFTGAATWFASVKVPVVGSPAAFTVTPSPADGATGQATGVTITLTFSNAIQGNAELGVTLTRVDTGAIIAVTRSLNGARTVLTLAHAALVSAKQYFITISGVKDVYGQTLADVDYDFTIA